jgi:hypothetical protein
MKPLHITMAGGVYDRTRAIIDGSVQPERHLAQLH